MNYLTPDYIVNQYYRPLQSLIHLLDRPVIDKRTKESVKNQMSLLTSHLRCAGPLTKETAIQVIPCEEISAEELRILPRAFHAMGFIDSPNPDLLVELCLRNLNFRLINRLLGEKIVDEETYGNVAEKISNERQEVPLDIKGRGLLPVRKALNALEVTQATALLASGELDYMTGADRLLLIYMAGTLYEKTEQSDEKENIARFCRKLAEFAIENYEIENLQYINRFGVDLTARLENGSTLLHSCAKRGFGRAIHCFLEYLNADPNETCTLLGQTALHVGLEQPRPTGLSPLIRKTNCDLRDYKGMTPLHVALGNLEPCRDYFKDLLEKTNLTLRDLDQHGFIEYTWFNHFNTPAELQLQAGLREEIVRRSPSPTEEHKEAIVEPKIKPDSWEKIFGHINSTPTFGARNYEYIDHIILLKVVQEFRTTRELDEPIKIAIKNGIRFAKSNNQEMFKKIAEQIAAGNLIILPVSSDDHAIYLVFTKGLLAICNRMDNLMIQGEILKPIEFFEIDSSKITPQDLEDLSRLVDMSTTTMDLQCYKILVDSLDGRKTDKTAYLESNFRVKTQKISNCTYANFKPAVRVAATFLCLRQNKPLPEAIKKGRKLSKSYSTLMRAESIDRSIRQPHPDWHAILHAMNKLRNRTDAERLSGFFSSRNLAFKKLFTAKSYKELSPFKDKALAQPTPEAL